jgi:hypothetical protein
MYSDELESVIGIDYKYDEESINKYVGWDGREWVEFQKDIINDEEFLLSPLSLQGQNTILSHFGIDINKVGDDIYRMSPSALNSSNKASNLSLLKRHYHGVDVTEMKAWRNWNGGMNRKSYLAEQNNENKWIVHIINNEAFKLEFLCVENDDEFQQFYKLSNTDNQEYISEWENGLNSKRVLLLGPDSNKERMAHLESIGRLIEDYNYQCIIMKNVPDESHSNLEEKFKKLVNESRFVIVENSEASGHLVEIGEIENTKIIALIRKTGTISTKMVEDYGKGNADIKTSFYDDTSSLKKAVREIAQWAETRVNVRYRLLRQLK